jgi:hypothetical protein
MFSTKWRTSKRQHGVVHERDVAAARDDFQAARRSSWLGKEITTETRRAQRRLFWGVDWEIIHSPKGLLSVLCASVVNLPPRTATIPRWLRLRRAGSAAARQAVQDCGRLNPDQIVSLKKEIFAPLERREGMTTSDMIWRIQNVMQPIK